MDEILVKYLLKETTDTEEQLVQEWIASKEKNRHYFEQLNLIWNESKNLAIQSNIDENAAWQRFKEKLAHNENIVRLRRPHRKLLYFRAAAGIALLLLGTWMAFYLLSPGAGMVALASGSEIRTDTLPDGSVVTLNVNSTIRYPERFSQKNRSVQLNGEAFFKVTPDKKRPFEIKVDDVSVQVVGTSFNIKNTNERTEVIVETGIVTVSKNKNKVRLLPKQKAVVSRKSKIPLVEKNNDDLYNYYRTKTFVCNNTPLYKLTEALNEAYQTHIHIANAQVRDLPLTTTFKDESLNNILSTIVETFHLDVERKGDTIILR